VDIPDQEIRCGCTKLASSSTLGGYRRAAAPMSTNISGHQPGAAIASQA